MNKCNYVFILFCGFLFILYGEEKLPFYICAERKYNIKWKQIESVEKFVLLFVRADGESAGSITAAWLQLKLTKWLLSKILHQTETAKTNIFCISKSLKYQEISSRSYL